MLGKHLALLVASDEARGSDERHALDRIRMQKAIFLLVQRGSDGMRDAYNYRAYDWGPYSGALTADVQQMQAQELLDTEPVPGSRYGRYVTTASGEQVAQTLWDQLSAQEQSFIRNVRAYVTGKSFAQLLREVYAAYPEYATASRFSG